MYKDDNETIDAIIEDIEKDGRLVLKDREGRVRKYLFKEVSYII